MRIELRDQYPSFYFIVVFWGKEHRGYFLDLCLPALLSPGNIPALGNLRDSKVVIVTTAEDWAALQDHPTFTLMKRYVEPVYIEMPFPKRDDNKMLVMSAGHKLASQQAFEDRALGVFLTPDLVLSDGSCANLQALALKGTKVVLCAAVRFTWEGCIPEMTRRFGMKPGDPLVLPARELTAVALDNLHSETKTYLWDKPYFAPSPFVCMWRVPGGDGVLMHSFSWAPLLVNYASLHRHNTDTFENWTLDGDYIHSNFPDPDDVYVVTDSDEVMLVSFTRESELRFLLWPHYLCMGPWADWAKVRMLRKLFQSDVIDPLKRDLFMLPIRWHTGDFNEAWTKVENRAIGLIQDAINTPHDGWNDYVFITVRYGTWKTITTYARFLRYMAYFLAGRARQRLESFYLRQVLRHRLKTVPPSSGWRQGVGRVLVALTEKLPFFSGLHTAKAGGRRRNVTLVNQLGVGTQRARVIAPALTAGRWYWEFASGNLGMLDGGIADTGTFGIVRPGQSLLGEIGGTGGGWGWRASGFRLNGGEPVTYGVHCREVSAVVMVAFDADAGKLWFGLNGQWFDGGDPATGTRPAFGSVPAGVMPAMSSRHGGCGTAGLESRILERSLRHAVPKGFRPLVTEKK